MTAFFRNNAAAFGALLNATVALVTAFGLRLTNEQVGALSAVIAVITGTSIQWHANVRRNEDAAKQEGTQSPQGHA